MRQYGELIVDHRASPGLPEDIARQAGYDPTLCREGKMYEAATMHCCECQGVVVKNPKRTRDRHSCSCGNYICDMCAFKLSMPDAVHKPLAQLYDEAQRPVNGTPVTLIIP